MASRKKRKRQRFRAALEANPNLPKDYVPCTIRSRLKALTGPDESIGKEALNLLDAQWLNHIDTLGENLALKDYVTRLKAQLEACKREITTDK